MTTKPPLPPSGKYLEAIRESSRNLRVHANIKVTSSAIERFLRSAAFTSSFKRVSAIHGLNLPLKFESDLDELNLISVLSILNFASGYRVPLHQHLQRGAWDTIRAFVFSLYITSSSDENLLSSQGMQSISMTKVAELMGVSLHTERPHENLPGVMIGELGGPLYDLVKLVTKVLNDTGALLHSRGYPNFGSFVLEALKEGARVQESQKSATAGLDTVLERLVKAFPAFQDMAIVEGKPIYCFKKALFLVHAVRIRFGQRSPLPFPVPNTDDSPIFADNVIPSLLVYLGVLDLSEAPGLSATFPGANSEVLQVLLNEASGKNPKPEIPLKAPERIAPKQGPILSNDQAFKLRASAIDACELIIKQARSFNVPDAEEHDGDASSWIRNLTHPDLDLWIWSVAKDRPDYRALERFSQMDTVFY